MVRAGCVTSAPARCAWRDWYVMKGMRTGARSRLPREVGPSILGGDGAFAIYGVDVLDEGECILEARVVISGTREEQTSDLSGSVALESTNVSGVGCDPDELECPGTGAEFSYTASRLDCEANLQAAQAYVQSAEARACTSDIHCTTEAIGCAQLQGAFCGDIALNIEAPYSDAWKAVEPGLRACAANECSVCDAILVPTCQDGLCQ